MSTGSEVETIGDFKKAVKQYVTLMDEVQEVNDRLKEKKKKIKKLSEFILTYMKENEKEVCDLGENGSLQIKKRKTKKFEMEKIESILRDYLKDGEKAKESTELIFKNQSIKESEVLHRNTKPL